VDAERRRTLPDRRRRRATPLLLATLGVAYVALSAAVWQLSDPTETSAPWWPAAGLTLGVLCRVRRRDWPAVLAVIFAAEVIADLIQGVPLLTGLGWAVADTVEPLLGALALGWAFRGRMPNIESPGNVLRFFAVALLAGTPLASLIGGATRALTYDVAFLEAWRVWYVGDVLGILVVAPVVLYFPQIRAAFDPRIGGMLAATALLVAAVFRLEVLRSYLIGPALVLIAIGRGAPAAIPAILLTATVGYVFSADGHGPFALSAGDTEALLGLQTFTAVQTLTVFLVVALRSQLLTARAQAERLTEEQLRDPLTGTGSRMLVEDVLAETASRPAVGDAPPTTAVLFLDLDGFKPVNDRYGHAAGDDVLCTIAQRLEDAVRDSDTVGRLGGDEFVVVCSDITPPELDSLADRIREHVARPITLDGERVVVEASIGTSWTSGPMANPSDLLRRADLDMYHRKLAHHASPTRPR
jgi:diguanylate cyclase (GGDEF)-like protein